MRPRIWSFSMPSVSDTLMVRSNGSSPDSTWPSTSITCWAMKSLSSRNWRNRFRVSSIVLARKISCSRVRSGISPICVRYRRTGSSIRRPPSIAEQFGNAAWRLCRASAWSGAGAAFRAGLCSSRDLEPHLLDLHEERVELLGVDRFVRQIVVDLRERQVALLAAEFDQLLQAIVKGMHESNLQRYLRLSAGLIELVECVMRRATASAVRTSMCFSVHARLTCRGTSSLSPDQTGAFLFARLW